MGEQLSQVGTIDLFYLIVIQGTINEYNNYTRHMLSHVEGEPEYVVVLKSVLSM